MKRLLVFVCWVLVGHLIVSADLAAQDLVITNARIIDGNGVEPLGLGRKTGFIDVCDRHGTHPSGNRRWPRRHHIERAFHDP